MERMKKEKVRLTKRGKRAVVVTVVATSFLLGNMVGCAIYADAAQPEKEVVIEYTTEQKALGYNLTELERYTIASVVTAEAGGEPYAGQMAVAQCLYQAVKDDGISPIEAIERYSYTDNRPEPTESAMMATVAVFEQGQTVTNEPIKYFYSPQRVSSKFHESQEFVMELNGHRFFSEKEV